MASAPTRPLDVPPYQLQRLLSNFVDAEGFGFDPSQVQVKCAQASGSEIYVGCSNGDLLRFTLQVDSYQLLSRQTLPSQKPIDQIVLVPCLARAFVLSDRTVHFYHLPTLEPVSYNTVKPIRHAVTFAIDHYDLQRPALSGGLTTVDPVNFCIIKRNAIAMYVMRERLSYIKEIPLPNGASHARRIGTTLLAADPENYNLIDLHNVELIPIIPLSQAPPPGPDEAVIPVNPVIEVIGADEFLILSSTGMAGTMGLFITTQGDPVRGTLQWPMHPRSVCLDYPYITALLPNDTIEIHNIDTQEIVQVVSAPPPSSSSALSQPNPFAPPSSSGRKAAHPPTQTKQRTALISSLNGYLVPSTQKSGKMGLVKVPLVRGGGVAVASSGDDERKEREEKEKEVEKDTRRGEVVPEIGLDTQLRGGALPVQEVTESETTTAALAKEHLSERKEEREGKDRGGEVEVAPGMLLSPNLRGGAVPVPMEELKQVTEDETNTAGGLKEDSRQQPPSPSLSASKSIAEEAEVAEALRGGAVAEKHDERERESEAEVVMEGVVAGVKEVKEEEVKEGVPVKAAGKEANEEEEEKEQEEDEDEEEEDEQAGFVYGDDRPVQRVDQKDEEKEQEQEGEGEFTYGERGEGEFTYGERGEGEFTYGERGERDSEDDDKEEESEGEFVYGEHGDMEEHEDDDEEDEEEEEDEEFVYE